MANALYELNVKQFLDATLAWSGNIKVVLIDTTLYTVNVNTHQFLSDIPSGARVATSGNLTGVTTLTGGIADADDVTLTAVTGAQVQALAAYKDTGTAGTSPLYLYFDTLNGFPINPNGTNVVVQWSNATSRIFQI